MNNGDDILKKILLNMRYDPKKTIKEQSSISNNAKKSDPGNPSLDEHKVISCLDGTEYVYPNLNVITKFEPVTSQAWTDMQTRLVDENKENDLTACKYQATIKVQQKRTELSYDDEVLDCINYMYQLYNNKPMFCATHFSMFDIEQYDGPLDFPKLLDYLTPKPKPKTKGIGSIEVGDVNDVNDEDMKKVNAATKQIYLFTTQWFKREYKKYQQNNSYLTREPYETETERTYKVWRETYYAPFVMDSIIDGEKDITITQASGSAEINNDQHFLPLTNAEKGQFNDIPLTKDDKFKNSGKYICKNRDKSMVNLRTSAEVNTDTGFFDPTDNYINWSGDEMIGEYMSEVKQKSYYNLEAHSLFGSELSEQDYRKWYQHILTINPSNFPEFTRKMVERADGAGYSIKDMFTKITDYNDYTWDLIMAPNFKDLMPKEIYDKLPGSRFEQTWYRVKLLKLYKDQTDGQTYDNAWVRSDNVNFCLPPKDTNSQTNYRLEYFKRIPMKALQDPPIKSNNPAPFGLGVK